MPPDLEERTLAGLHAFLEAEVTEFSRSAPILDLGCGSGAWLARLKRLGFSDLSGIDAGSRPGVEGVAFTQADLDQDRPSLERKFRLITMIEVIEHLANPGSALALIARHLAADGTALVTTPNLHSLRCRLKLLLTGKLASFDEWGDPTHTTPLLLPGFRKIAARHGLEIDKCWTFPRHGTQIFGAPIRIASAVLRLLVQDPLPGDTLCIRIVKRRGIARAQGAS
jgi:SAM-dependent methyltransferase